MFNARRGEVFSAELRLPGQAHFYRAAHPTHKPELPPTHGGLISTTIFRRPS
jgi:hypothetical protein